MNNWHLNRSVPVSLLAFIVITFFTATKSITAVELKTFENEREVARNDARIDALEKSAQKQEVALARIDENITHIREIMERMSSE